MAARAREAAEVLLVTLLLALFARTFVAQAFRIPTGSMAPNLRAGDLLLVNKFVYGATASEWERRLLPLRDPRFGDVAVFRYPRDPERDFVKRVIGVPGSTVAMVRRRLLVDGVAVDEPYLRHGDADAALPAAAPPPLHRQRDELAPLRVPARAYFVLGDNRDESEDSRFWGLVPRQAMRGRAVLVYWSWAAGPAPDARAPAPRLVH